MKRVTSYGRRHKQYTGTDAMLAGGAVELEVCFFFLGEGIAASLE